MLTCRMVFLPFFLRRAFLFINNSAERFAGDPKPLKNSPFSEWYEKVDFWPFCTLFLVCPTTLIDCGQQNTLFWIKYIEIFSLFWKSP